jgi:alpha-mannosidase
LDRSPNASPVEEILLLHHSHLDVGYTHSQPVVWELQQEFVSQAVDWLEQTAGLPEPSRPKWTCEATEPVRRWLAASSEPEIDRFTSLVQQGRIGFSALRWHVTANIDRAGLERLIEGKHELEQRLKTSIRVACQHDVNGVPWPLADVLIDHGIDLYVTATNPHLGRPVQPRPGIFNWRAPSGRGLRVFNGHAYTMFDQLLHSWDDSVDRMATGWRELQARLLETSYSLPFVYLTSTCSPVMWDNGPPNPFLPELVAKWNESELGPTIRYATFDDLLERVRAISDDDIESLSGDWTDYWSFGLGSAPVATALSRRAKRLLSAASTLSGSRPHPVASRAAELIDLYDEHTFAFWDTADNHPQTQTIEMLKQSLAHEGYELASFAVMDALERLAGNPPADRHIAAVLLCNASREPVVVRPELPKSWAGDQPASTSRTYRASRMSYDNRTWETTREASEKQAFGPVEVAPLSWRIIPIDRLPKANEAGAIFHRIEAEAPVRQDAGFVSVAADYEPRVGTIETSAYTVKYDPDSGRILSLSDWRGHAFLSPRLGIDFFSPVRERTDGLDESRRYAFYLRSLEREKIDISCWKDWEPVRESAREVTSLRTVEAPDRITLIRELEVPGARRLVQSFTLTADDPIIRIDVELELEPNQLPQAFYFAIPLSLSAGWRAVFDSAGATIELDGQQLPGTCRNWITAESFAAIGDETGAVVLLCPDAPLVQFGDFHFGPPLDEVPRPAKPLLLAWPVNNYWDTNFPRAEMRTIRLRYGFIAVDDLNEETIRPHAARFAQPPFVWPVSGANVCASSGNFAADR